MRQSINFKRIRNARDFLGIKNSEGRELDPAYPGGVFIRSAKLDSASGKDISKLIYEYNLCKIIDLRNWEEIKECPDVPIEGVKSYNIQILDASVPGISRETLADEELKKKAIELCGGEDKLHMSEMYRNLCRSDKSLSGFKEALQIIMNMEAEEGILWHCSEGKDRCGILSALFLHILGFDMDVIYEDYLASNITAKKNANKQYKIIKLMTRDEEKAALVRSFLIVDRLYLDAFFDEAVKRFGSVDELVYTGLGISKDECLRFRDKILI